MSDDLPPKVFFSGFGEWSLNLAVQAWYHPADQSKYEAWLQKACLQILSDLDAADIQLDCPGPCDPRSPKQGEVALRASPKMDRWDLANIGIT